MTLNAVTSSLNLRLSEGLIEDEQNSRHDGWDGMAKLASGVLLLAANRQHWPRMGFPFYSLPRKAAKRDPSRVVVAEAVSEHDVPRARALESTLKDRPADNTCGFAAQRATDALDSVFSQTIGNHDLIWAGPCTTAAVCYLVLP